MITKKGYSSASADFQGTLCQCLVSLITIKLPGASAKVAVIRHLLR